MTSIRVFSFDSPKLSMEEVEHLLKSPMIAARRLVKPLHLKVEAVVINEGASLLTDIQSLVFISRFGVSGRIIDTTSNLEIFHKMFLTKLYLLDSQLDQQGISVLEKLLHLKELVMEGKAIAGATMSFCNGGFAQLNMLRLTSLLSLEELKIEEGALPNLQHFQVHFCGKLKMIPHGLPKSVYVSCLAPCVSGVENYNVCPHVGEEENPLLAIYIAYAQFWNSSQAS